MLPPQLARLTGPAKALSLLAAVALALAASELWQQGPSAGRLVAAATAMVVWLGLGWLRAQLHVVVAATQQPEGV